MIRRTFRRLLTLGILGGTAWFVVKLLRGEPTTAFDDPPPAAPRPLAARAATPASPVAEPEPSLPLDLPAAGGPGGGPAGPSPWVDAVEGIEPASHPVKAKLKSGIYHLPGMLNYDRTVPDRWYLDAGAAEADGLRRAKR